MLSTVTLHLAIKTTLYMYFSINHFRKIVSLETEKEIIIIIKIENAYN